MKHHYETWDRCDTLRCDAVYMYNSMHIYIYIIYVCTYWTDVKLLNRLLSLLQGAVAHSWVHCQRSYSWVGRISGLITPTYLQNFPFATDDRGLSQEPQPICNFGFTRFYLTSWRSREPYSDYFSYLDLICWRFWSRWSFRSTFLYSNDTT